MSLHPDTDEIEAYLRSIPAERRVEADYERLAALDALAECRAELDRLRGRIADLEGHRATLQRELLDVEVERDRLAAALRSALAGVRELDEALDAKSRWAEELVRQRAALRQLVERARDHAVDWAWMQEAGRLLGQAGQGPGGTS